jgi:hypothetical protein
MHRSSNCRGVCGEPSAIVSHIERTPSQHCESVARCTLVFCMDSNADATEISKSGLAAVINDLSVI